MILTEDQIYQKLNEVPYASMITITQTDLASRTMMFGYSDGHIFLLTHLGTDKLEDIVANPKGLIHIARIENEKNQSFDISISGSYEICKESSPFYTEGFKAIGKKEPQVLGLLNSSAREDYALILFKVREIRGWSYYQIISGAPKTIIKGS
jgi:hypothetical protein